MWYVYILQSKSDDNRYYAGITDNLDSRITKHNAGEVPHTSKYKSWRLKHTLHSLMRSKLLSLKNI